MGRAVFWCRGDVLRAGSCSQDFSSVQAADDRQDGGTEVRVARCAAAKATTDASGRTDDSDESDAEAGKQRRCGANGEDAATTRPGMSTTTTPPHHTQHLYHTALPTYRPQQQHEGRSRTPWSRGERPATRARERAKSRLRNRRERTSGGVTGRTVGPCPGVNPSLKSKSGARLAALSITGNTYNNSHTPWKETGLPRGRARTSLILARTKG